jgi:F0F1-type ATP synthase gamma subunit
MLKTKLDSSNIFYGVLRVVKMTSMAKFNEITKHAKTRDLSLRVPVRILCNYNTGVSLVPLFFGIMTNSGKCGAINVNVMESISGLLVSSSKIITYGKKGFSLCTKFNGYLYTIFEMGSTSNRNLLIASRILLSFCFFDTDYLIIYNRYYGMTSRVVSFYNVYS